MKGKPEGVGIVEEIGTEGVGTGIVEIGTGTGMGVIGLLAEVVEVVEVVADNDDNDDNDDGVKRLVVWDVCVVPLR